MTIRDILREKHGIEIEDPLGRGNEGLVFRAKRLARDRRTTMPCAVKIYPFGDSLAEPPNKLLEEIESLVRLRDSNFVVRLLDVIVEASFVALVLEECEQSFADLLVQQQADHPGMGLARSECYRLCEQIARGLSDCHSDNVIHGDVKPHNMLLTRRGSAKLCDFGTARLDQSLSFLTSHGGTQVFMLPRHYTPSADHKTPGEQKAELTRDRDLFGLAISYAYLRLGRHPFRGGDPITEQFELRGLDDDEVKILRPILADERIPTTDVNGWFRQLAPEINISQTSAGSQVGSVQLLVDRVDTRRWQDSYQPDQRDIDDLHYAKTLLNETGASASDSDQVHGLRSRVLATLADLLARSDSRQAESTKLFSEAFEAISKAITLAPESAEHLAHRADLRLIAGYGGTHKLPLMFVLGPQVFDAPNSPWSSDVNNWHARSIEESLEDITKSCSLIPSPGNLARRALLLVLRAILMYRGHRFADTANLGYWFEDIDDSRRWRPLPVVFSQPLNELDRALQLSTSPLITANLLIQRAWIVAGFQYGLGDGGIGYNPYDVSDDLIGYEGTEGDWVWSLGTAIADLDRAYRTALQCFPPRDQGEWTPTEDPPESLPTSDDEYSLAQSLLTVIRNKRRSYSLRLALDLEAGAADLLGMLDIPRVYDYQSECDCLLPLIDMFLGRGTSGHVLGFSPIIKQFLQEPRRKHLITSPQRLSKFFSITRGP